MEKIKEILLLIPIFLILYVILCLIASFLISAYHFVVFWKSFKESFMILFLELLNPFNCLFFSIILIDN